MRILIVLSALSMVATGNLWNDAFGTVKNFSDYVLTKAVGYYSVTKEFIRGSIFGENLQSVKTHNKLYEEGKNSYKLAINEFSDLNFTEVQEKYTGLLKSEKGLEKSQEYKFADMNGRLDIAPEFDWRNHGGVTPVKKQGECKSSWAFGAVAAIEGHLKKITGKLTPLSPQHLVDCASEFENKGCSGGYQEYAFAYIAKNGGIALADEYRYKGKEGRCEYDPFKRAVAIKGFTTIPPKDEEKMKEIISNLGPLACSVALTNKFIHYKEGIFADPACRFLEPVHTVTVIGYGTDHWIIKNSWGHTWGENGYMRLAFKNWCSIASDCSYPIF